MRFSLAPLLVLVSTACGVGEGTEKPDPGPRDAALLHPDATVDAQPDRSTNVDAHLDARPVDAYVPLDAPGTLGLGSSDAPAAFSLHADNRTLILAQGASGVEYVGVTSLGGFAGDVQISAKDLPLGVTATPVNYTLKPGLFSGPYLPFTVAENAPLVGTTLAYVTGLSNGVTAIAPFYLAITAPPGTLDTTFGTNGIATIPFTGDVSSMVVQSDGKMVLSATLSLGEGAATELAVLRFNTDGTLDTAFGSAGIAKPPVPAGGVSSSGASALVLGANGRIYVGGQGATSGGVAEGVVVALTAEGALDTTFGSGGVLFDDECDLSSSAVDSLVLGAGAQILVASYGTSSSTASDSVACLARYSASGVLDTSFGVHGSVTLGAAGSFTQFGPTAFLGDGDLVGVENAGSGADPLVEIDGTGAVVTSFGAGTEADIFALAPTGGAFYTVYNDAIGTGLAQMKLQHVAANGMLDTAFGASGAGVFSVGSESVGASAMLVLSSGQVVVAGDVGNDALLVRFNSDGAVDTSFGTDGYSDTHVGPITSVRALALDASGRYIVVGTTQPAAGEVPDHIFFARFTP